MQSRRQGFTLLELSIVLVLIGLVIGGITAGATLLRASQVSSVMAESRSFTTAIDNFRLKYNYLPGDMPDATTYFPASANGNGNNLINSYAESYRAWQQLSQSKYLPGDYTGTSTGNASQLNVNSPPSKIDGGGWGLMASTSIFTITGLANVTRLFLGGPQSADITTAPIVLTPQEAYGVDAKMDDGFPNSGKVIAGANSGSGTASTTTCVTTNLAAAAYNMALASNICALAMELQ